MIYKIMIKLQLHIQESHIRLCLNLMEGAKHFYKLV